MANPASDSTTVAFIYKKMYSDRQVGDVTMREHPYQKMLKKIPGMVGSDWNYIVRYGNPQAVGGTFASLVATGVPAPSKGAKFSTTPALKYGYITLDGPSMAKARGDKGSFLDLVTMETDGVLEEMGDSLAFDLYRAGNGNRGKRASIAGNVVTLTVADDARNFKIGMSIIASANADGSSPKVNSQNVTVTAVDEDSGTVTVSDQSHIGSFANADYLFRIGDPSTAVDGLEDIIPAAAPAYTVDSFRGVDRGVHPRLLSGARITTATVFEEDIGSATVKVRQSGGRSDVCLTNPVNFWAAARRLNSKVTYDGGGNKATYGFEGIDIATPAGVVRMVSDPDCPTTGSWIGKTETAILRHLENYIHIIRDDDKPSMRIAGIDGIEIRARSMSQQCIEKPSCWAYVANA